MMMMMKEDISDGIEVNCPEIFPLSFLLVNIDFDGYNDHCNNNDLSNEDDDENELADVVVDDVLVDVDVDVVDDD